MASSISVVVKSADTSRTNTTTLTADPDLQAALLASNKYLIWISLLCDQTAGFGGGFRFNVSVPTGAQYVQTQGWQLEGRFSGSGLFSLGDTVPGDATSFAAIPPSSTDQTQMRVMAGFGVQTGVNAGSFILGWCQDHSSTVPSIIRARSIIEIVQV